MAARGKGEGGIRNNCLTGMDFLRVDEIVLNYFSSKIDLVQIDL